MRLARVYVRRKSSLQVERIGARFGRVFYRLSSKHRNRALNNLELAFPEKSAEERKALAKRVFEHFGMVTLDFIRSDMRSDEEANANTDAPFKHNLDEAAAKGRGLLIVTMHFGNWERQAQLSKIHGFPLRVVARDPDEEGLGLQIRELREASGMEVFSRGSAIRHMIAGLRENRAVGLLVDQNAHEAFIKFFGKSAGTTLGAAVLHLRTGAPILLCFFPRVGPGKYRFIVDPPLDFSGRDPKPAPEEIMQIIHNRFEEIIREYPEQWLWFHDRWKSARQAGLL